MADGSCGFAIRENRRIYFFGSKDEVSQEMNAKIVLLAMKGAGEQR